MNRDHAAATRGHHATDTSGDHTPRRPLAAVRPENGGGEDVGPRPRSAADPPAPLRIGGGLGYQRHDEAATLAALALAVEVETRKRKGPGVRWMLRDGLIGTWPWLHLADAAGRSVGVMLVAGQAWAILGPHVDGRVSGPSRLSYCAADLAPLARRLVEAIGRGLPAGPLTGA